MARSFFVNLNRLDEAEVEVEVEYHYSPGHPAHTPRGEYAPIDPPEGPEVEIVGATILADPTTGLRQPVTLTDAEAEQFRNWIGENHEPEERPED